jgi:hypothetical protein
VVDDPQPLSLFVSERVDDPGHLDQMRLVMTGQSVQLAGDNQAGEGDRPTPANGS